MDLGKLVWEFGLWLQQKSGYASALPPCRNAPLLPENLETYLNELGDDGFKSYIEMLNSHIDQTSHSLHRPLAELASATRGMFTVGMMGSSRMTEQLSPEKVKTLHETLDVLCREGTIECLMTGGGPGLMEVAMRTAKNAGCLTMAVKLPFDNEKGLKLDDFTDISIVTHEFGYRNAVFLAFADAYYYSWFGWGTIMELFYHVQAKQMWGREFNTEVLQVARSSNGLNFAPRLILGAEGYQEFMPALVENMLENQTIKPEESLLFHLAHSPEDAIAAIRQAKADWLDHREAFYQLQPEMRQVDKALRSIVFEKQSIIDLGV